jgi:hypothetical protein
MLHEPDEALQRFDDLMHLVMLTALLSKHSEAAVRFEKIKDDTKYLEGAVNSIPGGIRGYVRGKIEAIKSRGEDLRREAKLP